VCVCVFVAELLQQIEVLDDSKRCVCACVYVCVRERVSARLCMRESKSVFVAELLQQIEALDDKSRNVCVCVRVCVCECT